MTTTETVEPESKVEPVKVTRPASSLRVDGTHVRRTAWLVPVVLTAAAAALFFSNARTTATDDGAQEARKSVVTHVEQLLSYDYEQIDDDLAREKSWLTGSFADDYAKLVTDEIVPAALKAKVVTEAKVSASGVVSAEREEVELLVFVDVTTTSSELDQPRVSGSRLVVTVQNIDGEWRISALDPV